MEEKPSWREITVYNKKSKEILARLTLNANIHRKDIGVSIEIQKS